MQKKQNQKNTSTDHGEEQEVISASYFREREERDKRQYYHRTSDLPKGFELKTFKNAKCLNNEEKKFKESFERFCKNFEKIKKLGLGIFMNGTEGTGKTYYSLAIYNELYQKYRVYRTSLGGIFRRIRSSYSNGKESEELIFKEIKECELLILDDLGNEKVSESWGKENLFTLFNLLYENNISVIISTNLDAEDLTSFTSIYGSAKIIDRIKERCKPYAFNWESRRANINKKYFEELY